MHKPLMPESPQVLTDEQIQRKEENVRRRKEAVLASQESKTKETIEKIRELSGV